MSSYRLTRDLTGMFKPHRLYASRGDPVELISVRGEVAIVENTSGERFSVRLEFLYKSEEKAFPQTPEKYSTKSEENIPIPEKPKRKIIRKTGRTNDSLSLF